MRTAIAASIIAVLAFFGSIEDLGGYLTQADGVVVFTGEPQRILTGDCQKFRVRGRVDHHAVTNLPSNMMANWVLASHHSRGGIFHSAATSRKTR